MFEGLGPVIFAWALFLRAFGSDNVFGGQSFMPLASELDGLASVLDGQRFVPLAWS